MPANSKWDLIRALKGFKLKGALKERKHNFAVSYKQTTSNGDYEITASLAVLCDVSRSN